MSYLLGTSESFLRRCSDILLTFSTKTSNLDTIKYGFDLRLATCKWMTENLEHIMKSFVPPSHPRKLVPSNNSGLTIAAFLISAVSILLAVFTTGGIIYKKREVSLGRSRQVLPQVEFLLFLLVGILMVSIGGLLLATEPSKGTCIGSMWLINIGYTAQLVPTLICVSTILKIVKDSMKMKRVTVDKKKMFRRSIGFIGLAAVYCLFWTIFDTPHSEASLQVTDVQNEFGETIVNVSHYCDSDSHIWFYISFTYQATLLLCASALAYQMRQVPNVSSSLETISFLYLFIDSCLLMTAFYYTILSLID